MFHGIVSCRLVQIHIHSSIVFDSAQYKLAYHVGISCRTYRTLFWNPSRILMSFWKLILINVHCRSILALVQFYIQETVINFCQIASTLGQTFIQVGKCISFCDERDLSWFDFIRFEFITFAIIPEDSCRYFDTVYL